MTRFDLVSHRGPVETPGVGEIGSPLVGESVQKRDTPVAAVPDLRLAYRRQVPIERGAAARIVPLVIGGLERLARGEERGRSRRRARRWRAVRVELVHG